MKLKYTFVFNILLLSNHLLSQTNTFPLSGNVGIGTTLPLDKLHIYNGNIIIQNDFPNGNSVTFKGSAGLTVDQSQIKSDFGAQWGGILRFFTSPTGGTPQPLVERMTIIENGNVGIGTTALDNKLSIGIGAATGDFNQGISIRSGNGTYSTGHGGMLQFQNEDVITAGIRGIREGGWASGLGLYTHNSSSGNTFGTTFLERMRIDNNGNIGIGTSNPLNKLHIAGGDIGIDLNQKLILRASDPSASYLTYTTTGTQRTLLYGYYGLDFSTNNGQMVLTQVGNVGIGTTSPGPYKLAVEGTLGARKIKVTQANPWADYVFNEDYKLKSLTEVEQYIKTNKHLPEIPSAKEVERDGIDVGENQALLLKKIEELTLYMIEMKKENARIKNDNQQIKKENSVLNKRIEKLENKK